MNQSTVERALTAQYNNNQNSKIEEATKRVYFID